MRKAKPRKFSIEKYNKVLDWAAKRYIKSGKDYFYSYAVYKQIEFTAASRYLNF